jgi:hypothetical protein
MDKYILRTAAIIGAPAVALAFVLVAPGASASLTPAAALPCHASMSNGHPKDYTTIDVRVSTVGHAGVTTVAHYKTVNRKHSGAANAKGLASIPYYISGATVGYRVKVSVSVKSGSRTGSCSTSFTPHA